MPTSIPPKEFLRIKIKNYFYSSFFSSKNKKSSITSNLRLVEKFHQ